MEIEGGRIVLLEHNHPVQGMLHPGLFLLHLIDKMLLPRDSCLIYFFLISSTEMITKMLLFFHLFVEQSMRNAFVVNLVQNSCKNLQLLISSSFFGSDSGAGGGGSFTL